jgi:hypothetical protein
MAKETKPAKLARPSRGLGKKSQNFRLTPETIRKLDVASRQYGASKAVYVEMALKAQFKRDGV